MKKGGLKKERGQQDTEWVSSRRTRLKIHIISKRWYSKRGLVAQVVKYI